MAPVDQAPPIVCSIVQQEIGDRVQLRGRVMSGEETQGRYTFRIVKTGPSGSSTVSQGGAFAAPANRETLVGLASFNLEPGAQFAAQMSLQIGDRTVLCESSEGGSL
jgi:hypothetical protein